MAHRGYPKVHVILQEVSGSTFRWSPSFPRLHRREIRFSTGNLHAEVIFWPDEVPVLEDDEVPCARSGNVSRDDIEKLVQKHFIDPMAAKIVQFIMDEVWGHQVWKVTEHWNSAMSELGYVHISDRDDAPKKEKRGSSGK